MKEETKDSALGIDKYKQTLSKYALDVDTEKVREAVQNIIREKVLENDTPDVKKFLLGSIEHTSLHVTDTEEEILSIVERLNKFGNTYPTLPHIAAICVYPRFTNLVSQSLEVDNIEITTVCGGFPAAQTFAEIKVAETALAVADGSTEIDTVLPLGMFLSEDYEGIADEIAEIKDACAGRPLKVILETGCLKNLSQVKEAAILAMYSGADYIKTSTGKEKIGATPEAVYVMCQAIRDYYEETGIQIGIKPAGGINSVMDAIVYYTIVKEILGEKWLTNKWFRIGTSRLTDLLINELTASC